MEYSHSATSYSSKRKTTHSPNQPNNPASQMNADGKCNHLTSGFRVTSSWCCKTDTEWLRAPLHAAGWKPSQQEDIFPALNVERLISPSGNIIKHLIIINITASKKKQRQFTERVWLRKGKHRHSILVLKLSPFLQEFCKKPWRGSPSHGNS